MSNHLTIKIMNKKQYIIPTIKTAILAENLMLEFSDTQGDGNQLSKEIIFDDDVDNASANVWDE